MLAPTTQQMRHGGFVGSTVDMSQPPPPPEREREGESDVKLLNMYLNTLRKRLIITNLLSIACSLFV